MWFVVFVVFVCVLFVQLLLVWLSLSCFSALGGHGSGNAGHGQDWRTSDRGKKTPASNSRNR